MHIILFDNKERRKLYPLTKTRAVAEIRCGLLTAKTRWQSISENKVFILTEDYLQCLYEKISPGNYLFIDASIIPSEILIEKIFALKENEALANENDLTAGRTFYDYAFNPENILSKFKKIFSAEDVQRIEYPWEIFQRNDEMIRSDFALVTKNQTSQKISSTNQTISSENIFIEDGATVEYAILNAAAGPIYIGKNATVMEGCIIRGPFAMCENSTLKTGAKIYAATTIGISSTGGGEIKNSLLQDFSNKAHDGYLGDSVIGSWCNIGAGTSNSNIKNTAADILMYNFFSSEKINAGSKCGVIMGDYTRVAINSSVNTGSIFGVCCNIFGEGLLPKMIDDFIWGSENLRYTFEKALHDLDNWKKLKKQSLNENEVAVLKYIFNGSTTK